jgi:AcrR family transcriptional regulator
MVHKSKGNAMGSLIERRKAEWDSMMKSSISEATISVLNEYGFDGLRMDRVATAAEVAKGTLYNYFRDKDELLLHVIDTKFTTMHQMFLEIRESDRTPPEKLEAYVRAIFDLVEEYRSLFVIIHTAEGLSLAVKQGANAKRETVRQIYAEIIDEGINQGFFRPFDSLLAARMILAALSGLVESIIANNDGTIDLEKNVSECMKLFLSGLSAKE